MLKKKDVRADKKNSHQEHKNAAPAEPYTEPAIPIFLCLVSMVIALICCVIDSFIYPFGDNLLAPMVLELLAIVFPCYLILLAIYSKRSFRSQMRIIGFGAIKVRYVFFLVFSALFMISASIMVSIIFGGVYSAANGYTLLGTFTVGENDFNVSWPYLILVYALIPAIAEELLLRGMVMSQLDNVGFATRALVSAVLSALLGFSLGGAIPAMFVSVLVCFVLYTTRSLWACMIVRFIFNLFRLFLETNISEYYISTAQRGLLLIVLFAVMLISGALFFAEASRIYRERAKSIIDGEVQSRQLSISTVKTDMKKIASYRPTIILSGVCAAIFATVVIINYFA